MNPASNSSSADPAELAKFDALAHRFWDEAGEFAPLHRLNPVRADYVAQRVRLAGATTLDVGCGGGLLTEELARRGAQVTGIDLAPSMIEVARLHAAEVGSNATYRLEDAADTARDNPAGFAVVTCMEMLEHLPDPAAMLATLARLLAPQGNLFVSTVNRNLKSFLMAIVGAEYVLRLLPRGTHEYDRLIRPAELARWARACGLELLDVRGLHYNPLTQECRLQEDPSVNYLAHFVHAQAQRPA